MKLSRWVFVKLWFIGFGWGVYKSGVPYVHIWLKGVGMLAFNYWKHAIWKRRLMVGFVAA